MPSTCCIPGCRSNYRNSTNFVKVFKFPEKGAKQYESWLKSIPRKDWTPGKRTAVCIKHFREQDIVSFDKLPRDDGTVTNIPRLRWKLVTDAVPCLFNDLPNYLSPKEKNRQKPVDMGFVNIYASTSRSVMPIPNSLTVATVPDSELLLTPDLPDDPSDPERFTDVKIKVEPIESEDNSLLSQNYTNSVPTELTAITNGESCFQPIGLVKEEPMTIEEEPMSLLEQ